MTIAEKILNVQKRVDDASCTDELARIFLDDAAEAIFQKMYPWGVPASVTDVPSRYERLQCKLAARYFLRTGGEGESLHIENGTHRHWGSVNDADLLQEVMQVLNYKR